ncbi:MAG: hypothetical protein M3P93_09265, partial [Actinomycetota bacterium]|nr:hypothetical protein [Actinomycetota bacterium]
AVQFRRAGGALGAAGAALGLASCAVLWRHHVFPPRGVGASFAVGAALVLLALARERSRSSERAR